MQSRFSRSPAAELPRFAGRAERTEADWAIRWQEPAGGRVWDFTIDFDTLTAELAETSADPDGTKK